MTINENLNDSDYLLPCNKRAIQKERNIPLSLLPLQLPQLFKGFSYRIPLLIKKTAWSLEEFRYLPD
ncbi:hypothetical protein BVE85_09900 [Streptococcus azizii]|nr:hypothetical protein BVE85_09900 [Streptococcus azizii]